MNLIRATLRALVEETLKLRFGGGKSDPETSNPNNHGETNFQTMAKNHRCFGKRSRTDTQMHQNCLYFGAITMFIEVHVADKPKSSKFSDLTLAWVCLKKGIPFRPILYLFAFFKQTRRRLARERKKCFSSSSEDGSRKR